MSLEGVHKYLDSDTIFVILPLYTATLDFKCDLSDLSINFEL